MNNILGWWVRLEGKLSYVKEIAGFVGNMNGIVDENGWVGMKHIDKSFS